MKTVQSAYLISLKVTPEVGQEEAEIHSVIQKALQNRPEIVIILLCLWLKHSLAFILRLCLQKQSSYIKLL
jgi:hypothetical protein